MGQFAQDWARGVLVAAATLLCLPLCSQAQSILANGGFETNGTGWGSWGDVECAAWAKETGSYGAAFRGWVINGSGGFFQSVRANPDMTYTFTIRCRKEDLFDAASVYLRLEFYKEDDLSKAGHDQGAVNIATKLSDTWQSFTVKGTAPLGTVFVRPVFGFSGATKGDLKKGKQACFWDNAELVSSP